MTKIDRVLGRRNFCDHHFSLCYGDELCICCLGNHIPSVEVHLVCAVLSCLRGMAWLLVIALLTYAFMCFHSPPPPPNTHTHTHTKQQLTQARTHTQTHTHTHTHTLSVLCMSLARPVRAVRGAWLQRTPAARGGVLRAVHPVRSAQRAAGLPHGPLLQRTSVRAQ